MLQILYSSGGLFATKMDIKKTFWDQNCCKIFNILWQVWTFSSQIYAFFLSWRTFTHFLTFLQKKTLTTAVYKLYKKKADVLVQVSVPKRAEKRMCPHSNLVLLWFQNLKPVTLDKNIELSNWEHSKMVDWPQMTQNQLKQVTGRNLWILSWPAM